MNQSRRMSLIEAISNTAVGYGVAVLTQIIVFPLVGISATFHLNLVIAAIFTGVSLVRNYLWRRLFVWIHAGKVISP